MKPYGKLIVMFPKLHSRLLYLQMPRCIWFAPYISHPDTSWWTHSVWSSRKWPTSSSPRHVTKQGCYFFPPLICKTVQLVRAALFQLKHTALNVQMIIKQKRLCKASMKLHSSTPFKLLISYKLLMCLIFGSVFWLFVLLVNSGCCFGVKLATFSYLKK